MPRNPQLAAELADARQNNASYRLVADEAYERQQAALNELNDVATEIEKVLGNG